MKGKHTSLDKALKPSILWIENLSSVSKVILGFSKACRHKYPPGHIRYKKDVDGGIKVNGHSGNGVVDIFIRISPIEERDLIKESIQNRFSLKN